MISAVDAPRVESPGVPPVSPVETYRGFERLRDDAPSTHVMVEAEVAGHVRHLRQPIAVEIKMENATWFAENSALNLFGSGSSADAALCEFRQHLGFFAARYLSLGSSDVIGEGTRLKDLYDRIFS